MNRDELRELRKNGAFPCISILLPTHRDYIKTGEDRIRLKNLVGQARERLHSELPRSEADGLVKKLEDLCDGLDFRYMEDGLAILLNRNVSKVYPLPFQVPERVVVDRTFHVREILRATHRSQQYGVLILSDKRCHFLRGHGETLRQVEEGGFPHAMTGPGADEPLPGGKGINRSAYLDDRRRQFYKTVQESLQKLLYSRPLPLVLFGAEKEVALFRDLAGPTHLAELIVGVVPGSHEKSTASELARRAWPLMKQHLDEKARACLETFKSVYHHEHRGAMGLEAVWRRAREGRIHTLLVEESFEQPARIDEDLQSIRSLEEPSRPSDVEDAVDDVVETVITHGGRVVFCEEGTLGDYGRIGAILRG